MRSNIHRRLKQLEQKAHIHNRPPPVIFVRFVAGKVRPDEIYPLHAAVSVS
jgi:hypothetical protein